MQELHGESQIILGTHALIQEKVEYQNLALVVNDNSTDLVSVSGNICGKEKIRTYWL